MASFCGLIFLWIGRKDSFMNYFFVIVFFLDCSFDYSITNFVKSIFADSDSI